MQIWKFFKVADPLGVNANCKRNEPGYDPKYWYRPLYEELQKALMRLFTAGGYIVVDEYMQASHHRCHYRRKMVPKPNSEGLLWYLICGLYDFHDNDGKVVKGATLYVPFRFELYTANEPWRRVPGPRGGRGKPPPEWRGYGEGACFALSMLSVLLWNGVVKRGTTLLGDRLFSSIRFVLTLHEMGLRYIGTCKRNVSALPTFVGMAKNAERGTTAFKASLKYLGLVVAVWKDSCWTLWVTMG